MNNLCSLLIKYHSKTTIFAYAHYINILLKISKYTIKTWQNSIVLSQYYHHDYFLAAKSLL